MQDPTAKLTEYLTDCLAAVLACMYSMTPYTESPPDIPTSDMTESAADIPAADDAGFLPDIPTTDSAEISLDIPSAEPAEISLNIPANDIIFPTENHELPEPVFPILPPAALILPKLFDKEHREDVFLFPEYIRVHDTFGEFIAHQPITNAYSQSAAQSYQTALLNNSVNLSEKNTVSDYISAGNISSYINNISDSVSLVSESMPQTQYLYNALYDDISRVSESAKFALTDETAINAAENYQYTFAENITDDKLKLIKETAEREAVNTFTTAEIRVDMGGVTNNLSRDRDLDEFMELFRVRLEESLCAAAEGVHM